MPFSQPTVTSPGLLPPQPALLLRLGAHRHSVPAVVRVLKVVVREENSVDVMLDGRRQQTTGGLLYVFAAAWQQGKEMMLSDFRL